MPGPDSGPSSLLSGIRERLDDLTAIRLRRHSMAEESVNLKLHAITEDFCRLIAAIEALSSALRTHQNKLTDSKGEFCAGCLEPWPCPDSEAIVAGALGGTQLSEDGSDRG